VISDKFIILGILIQLWGCLVYAKDTAIGKTKPNRVTWFLWFLAPTVAFAAELNKGVGLVSAMTLSVGLGPLIVLVASFANKKSYWKLHWTDYFCGFLSLLGLALWVVFKDADIAIVLNIAADLSAAAPTLVKSFNHPETESVEAYWVAIVNAGITLLAVDTWTVANYGFPIYIFIVNIVFVALIKYKLGLKLQGKPA
jgi:phosphoglycerol transferase MdoB-like AlkP superfamily enzyme